MSHVLALYFFRTEDDERSVTEFSVDGRTGTYVTFVRPDAFDLPLEQLIKVSPIALLNATVRDVHLPAADPTRTVESRVIVADLL